MKKYGKWSLYTTEDENGNMVSSFIGDEIGDTYVDVIEIEAYIKLKERYDKMKEMMKSAVRVEKESESKSAAWQLEGINPRAKFQAWLIMEEPIKVDSAEDILREYVRLHSFPQSVFQLELFKRAQKVLGKKS